MTEVEAVVNSNNLIYILIVVLVIFFTIVFLLVKGKLSFKGKGLIAGNDSISSYSRVKQLQWDYLQAETEIALRSLPKEYLESPKVWRTHYVLGKYRDVLEQALILNNIIDDEEYIESKQILAYSQVLKVTEDDFFKSDDFKNYLYDLTKKLIKQFYKIKRKYES